MAWDYFTNGILTATLTHCLVSIKHGDDLLVEFISVVVSHRKHVLADIVEFGLIA